jgi:hypothetical protein
VASGSKSKPSKEPAEAGDKLSLKMEAVCSSELHGVIIRKITLSVVIVQHRHGVFTV